MTSERWQQIDALFHESLAREPTERLRYLVSVCGDDESLRHEVESLISAHGEASDFIETPAGDVAAEMLGTHQSAFEPGQQVENYRIVSQLGSGGMGEVYLADDMRLNRKVALKLLPPRSTINPDRIRRFEREARAASALNHPNIVTIYEISKSNSAHFIATEFVDGKTLRQLMTEKPLKLSETLNVAIQVAGALVGAHAAGIVHRDIKPENIMIRSDGYVKVLDFGLAKLNEKQEVAEIETETPTLLQSNPGLVMGTVQYMSPEQARGKNVDARSDIWSLGIVLFELLTGHVPFTGETPSHVMVSLMEDELSPLTNYENVPSELARIVVRTLRKNRRQRYQKTAELAADLKRIKQKLQMQAALPKTGEFDKAPAEQSAETATKRTSRKVTPPTTQPLDRLSSAEYLITGITRHRRTFALFAAILILTITATGYFYFGRHRLATVRSIAVLPFKNAGNSPDMDYLADGLSESLTNNLAPVPGLSVISRYSSFKYKGKEVDPQEVAKNLGVDAIVTGRITQVNDSYLISVELVDARDRSQIWAKQYNRKSSDLLIVMAETSREITDELRLRLTSAEQQQLTTASTVNPQAYDLFLKGRSLWVKGGTDNKMKAIDYYKQAIAVNPGYALAHAELSRSYGSLITTSELSQQGFSLKAEAAAFKALELDQNLADAHLAVANIKINEWEWPMAESEIKRALELNPNFVAAHRLYAIYLSVHRRLEEAVAEINRARDLDPLSTSSDQARLTALTMFRQNDQALEIAKKLVQLDPTDPGAREGVGALYSRVGRYSEAISAYQETIKLGNNSPDVQLLLGCAYAKSGERDKAREILDRYALEKDYSRVGLAMLHVALGERDQAFAALEAAYAVHDQQLIWLRGEWEFDVLHDDPRFQDLARRVGLF